MYESYDFKAFSLCDRCNLHNCCDLQTDFLFKYMIQYNEQNMQTHKKSVRLNVVKLLLTKNC